MADHSDAGLLNQAEIDALLGGGINTASSSEDNGAKQTMGDALSPEELDALGEIANIAMGSAATTLSTLLNHRVSITSPQIEISTQRDLMARFCVPYLLIEVNFIDGLKGANLLVIKTHDAGIIADLMMGNDGSTRSEELSDIEISATAEAMNQMMGASATAMSTIFGRGVSISPPEVRLLKAEDDLIASVGEPVVVVRFRMMVEGILDTEIMEVLGTATAREEASFLLGGMEDLFVGEQEMGKDPAPVETISEPNGVTAAAAPAVSEAPSGGRSAVTGLSPAENEKLQMLLDIPLKVTVVLGRTRRPIKDILGFTPGSIVELATLVDEPVEVLVNGTPVARGEVVVVNENFGVRITNIISPQERVQQLGQ